MGDKTIKLEDESEVYKTLLESTRAIPWKIDWETMTFSYIGPQIESLLGWPRESWISANDWAMRMHEDDREKVVNFCISQSKAGVDHEADYRALTKDGGYIWIRDVVHVVRNEDGSANSLIGFMFDITERKQIEEELVRLQKEFRELSYKDGLTGVANRRMFDSVLDIEWSNALRNKQPLSVILIDIDYFKQYNDHYGHIQGDDCLKRVATALSKVGTRARDFFARYGGEEFILVLPETDTESAQRVAERCRAGIFKEQIPHEKSDAGQILTISLGIGTITPTHNDNQLAFMENVDRQLYLAKQRGRNCIVNDC
jgi:diguanylate cyclase (GGDEF)-like protein/PAS domain S-box-containing protein